MSIDPSCINDPYMEMGRISFRKSRAVKDLSGIILPGGGKEKNYSFFFFFISTNCGCRRGISSVGIICYLDHCEEFVVSSFCVLYILVRVCSCIG